MNIFRFKKFSVTQNDSIMKVGIDSVMLGSWIDFKSPNYILDVGTGTGLLSLMMAQRYRNAKITALEIDSPSFREAKLNFKNSAWSSRINAIECDAKVWDSLHKFDLIICNPPFFSNSFLSKQKSKNRARHQVEFNLNDLVRVWLRHGTINSNMCCILPLMQAKEIINIINSINRNLIKFTLIKSKQNKKPNRIMLQFSIKKENLLFKDTLCIYSSINKHSKEFINLTKEFYLNH